MVTTTTDAEVNELCTASATPTFAEAVDANNATASLLLAKEALITAIQDRKLHRGHLVVLAAVAHFMSNKTAKAWPGRKAIAEFTGLSLTTVSNLLLELRKFGHLLRGKENVEEAGNRRLNVYTWGKIDHETLGRQISDIIFAMKASGAFEKSSPDKTSPGKVLPQQELPNQESPPPAGCFSGESSPDRTSGAKKSSQGKDSINKINNTLIAGGDANPSPAPRKREAKPRTKLPEDWTPSSRTVTWALENFHATERQVMVEARKFRAYHVGQGSLKANWFATWQTWWENEFHKIPRRTSSLEPLPSDARPKPSDALAEAFERARLADEAEARCRR